MKNNLKFIQVPEVCYSFDSLYFAAFGKVISKTLKAKFQKLPQNEINNLVLKWAKKAKWKTKAKKGNDGVIYVAFHP